MIIRTQAIRTSVGRARTCFYSLGVDPIVSKRSGLVESNPIRPTTHVRHGRHQHAIINCRQQRWSYETESTNRTAAGQRACRRTLDSRLVYDVPEFYVFSPYTYNSPVGNVLSRLRSSVDRISRFAFIFYNVQNTGRTFFFRTDTVSISVSHHKYMCIQGDSPFINHRRPHES